MKKYLFLLISVMLINATKVKGQTWSSTGVSYPSIVYAISDYNGILQVGGEFSAPNEIRALCVYNGDLYSGGTNGGASTHVYKNGVSIGALSGGANFVFAMTVYNGQLYVAGSFASINGVAANNIARWNGAAWTNVAAGIISDYINALCVYNGTLYAGGGQSGYCHKWNGSAWSVSGNFSENGNWGYIRSMGVYANELYVGGTFDTVNGAGAVNLAKYNGASWSSPGDVGIAGIGNGVSAIAEYNGELYCGGNFSVAGGTSASNIARWSGAGWQALGSSGTSGVVFALHVFNQILYAGGNFTNAGGISVGNIAKWAPPCTPPAATITYTGAPVLCNPGGSLLLSGNSGTGLTYQWKKNGSTVSGATSASYNVTVTGTYTVVVTNAVGCSATSPGVGIGSNTVFANITPSASIVFCAGSSALLTAYVSNGYTYQWKKNGVAIGGATSSTYAVTSAGNYTVDETYGPCTKSSNAVSVTVNPLPSASISANGLTTFCQGGSVVLNAPFAANLSYQWKKGGVNISGATSSSYTATKGGTYKVTVTNTTTGCTKTTANAIVVTVNALPAASVTPQGPTTFCAGGNVVLQAGTGAGLSYKWKKNGSYIPAATASNYTAVQGGTYKAEVTDGNGCSKTSSGIVVTVPCKEGDAAIDGGFNVSVYPNPSDGNFIISVENESGEKTSLSIFDAMGRMIKTEIIYSGESGYQISNLVPGIYLIMVKNNELIISQKVIVE